MRMNNYNLTIDMESPSDYNKIQESIPIEAENVNEKIYIMAKQILDKMFAIGLLIIFSIPMLVVSILIKLEDGGPILYKSKRIGKNLKEIDVYKFRSMKCNREELKSELSHEEMVTKIGKILRKTSFDELPQLFNIIKGNMSFIGPRPWIPEYYKYFTEEQKRRSKVIPGISGLAQVNGRNGINIEQKINYDLEYVDNISLSLDIKLILKTIGQVFKKTNAEITEQGIKEEIAELRKNKLKSEEKELNLKKKVI